MADENLDEIIEDAIEDAVEASEKKRTPIKLEWLVTAGTALTMVVSGVYSITSAESRVNERILTIEKEREAEKVATDLRVAGYDARIAELEDESEALQHELSIRREYQRHVHAHICALLAKAHGPKSAQTEKLCSLPQPEFKK